MNLVIDIGNTNVKAATFKNDELMELYCFSDLTGLNALLSEHVYEAMAVCSSKQHKAEIIAQVPNIADALFLNADSPLPIKVSYKTPKTLGMDRLAGAVGAHVLFPGKSVLIVDLGTCITYDLLHDETFQGGMIAPGLQMRFRAMHEFTANLPLLSLSGSTDLIGKSTNESMNSGAFFGVIGEIEHHISQLMLNIPDLKVIMTGGDAHLFESMIKSDIFVAPEIVLVGMNGVSKYNA